MATTSSEPLPLGEVFNFRDLGGHETVDGRKIRTGRVFRADGLHRLQRPDRVVLDELQLRNVIDLRTPAEVEEWGHAPSEVTGATVHHLPMIVTTWNREDVDDATDAAAFLAGKYRQMLDEGSTTIATSLRLIADEGQHGVVFHCAAGKDRTGVLAAIVLGLCGVPDDTLAADFGATAPAMERMRAWYYEHHPERREIMAQQPPAFAGCPPEAMHQFLGHLRADFGSIEAYVTDVAGLDSADIDRLRAALRA
ncbi:MAG: tyrosine-protein phosphatase [Actinomycetota bacterium]